MSYNHDSKTPVKLWNQKYQP